ncbi:MAG: cytochrome c3 family protein [Calditrichaceae bacterium]
MRLIRQISLQVLLLMVVSAGYAGENCVDCHKGIESSCNITCADCHSSPNADFQPDQAGHSRVIQNPSLEKWWREKCLSCHQKEITQFKNSLHYSAGGMISQTRYLWGKDKTLVTNPDPDQWKLLGRTGRATGTTPPELVDNLLAKKCLSCHFNASGKDEQPGKIRAGGCASCHIPFDQKNGEPLHGHKMQKKVVDKTCLTCHSNNHIGGDYYGYFEHDYHQEYATPYGSQPFFGAYQHRLATDVHQNAGMTCLDCHTSQSVMGDFRNRKFGEQPSDIRCENCHGGFKQAPNKKDVIKFNKDIISHMDFHADLTCGSCHAQWSYQDYGLHLFLDETKHYEIWENLIWQGDKSVINLLTDMFLIDPTVRPTAHSPNRLTGVESTGIWYKGWSFRRWEDPVLGVNSNGKYSIIRPLHQYFITYVDSSENLWLDSVIPKRSDGRPGWSWDAYTPHTTGKSGRVCESCHGNTKAAGLGIRNAFSNSVSNSITLPTEPVIPGSRLLNSQEQRRLLEKSADYKKWRTRAFKNDGIEELFNK